MTNSRDHDFFSEALKLCTNRNHVIKSVKPISGGDINEASKINTSSGSYFIKWQNEDCGDMFEKEAEGLFHIKSTKTIRTPSVIGFGKISNRDFLILEYIQNKSPSTEFWRIFGRSVAALHGNTNTYYGLNTDNYIGKLPQSNKPTAGWIDFFINERLLFQAKYGIRNGSFTKSIFDKLEKLYSKLPTLLPEEKPSLLHGDLWSGNFMSDDEGNPIIYDPAVYYGHREMELAFTHLFGGFDHEFYDAYQEVWPIQSGFEERMAIYQLYPLLVHANLFGGSYTQSVENILNRFI